MEPALGFGGCSDAGEDSSGREKLVGGGGERDCG